MEIDLGAENSQLSQITDEGLKFFNVFIPARLPKLDTPRSIVIHDSAVDLDAVFCQPIVCRLHHIEVGVDRKLDVNPPYPDLFEEQKLIIACARTHHRGDLGVRRIMFLNLRGSARDSLPRQSPCHTCRGRQSEKITAVWTARSRL